MVVNAKCNHTLARLWQGFSLFQNKSVLILDNYWNVNICTQKHISVFYLWNLKIPERKENILCSPGRLYFLLEDKCGLKHCTASLHVFQLELKQGSKTDSAAEILSGDIMRRVKREGVAIGTVWICGQTRTKILKLTLYVWADSR